MAAIDMRNIVKTYGDGFKAVNDVSIDVQDGEFMILVGPSGCGKSTLLRMIVGLEDITEGEMVIGDKVVNDLAPRDRNLAMVFQNYALYPHLSVYENIAFPLRLAKASDEDVDKKVLADAGITALENPRAFLVVDDTSLVISISPEAPIRQIIADIAQPAVMIWNRVEEAQRGAELIGQTEWCGPLFKCSNVSDVLTYFCLLSEDNISPRVEDMVRQHYAELSFPVDQEHFGSRISLYIRNTRSHQ